MKTLMLVKSSALVLALSAGFYLMPQDQSKTAASCVNTVVMNPNGIESFAVHCALAPQTSWMSWFSGQSSSAQFHFIDLLELLSRLHATPQHE
jgi:hypothetical protein